MQLLLLISVAVIATCGLIYELVAGTLASYLLGDSVTQFSTIIGVYLFSMGIGSYLSKFIEKNILAWFIQIEILVGFVGGTSSTILFLLFEQASSFRIVLYLLIVITGTLVGMEIPLLLRILKDKINFKDLVSKVFTFDYVGALLASVIFPLVLIPYLGLLKTSYLFGLLNVLVAYIICVKFDNELRWARYLKTISLFIIALLVCGFVFANKIMAFSESLTYQDRIIYSKSSPYQKIVITAGNNNLKLFLNGNLQFNSLDEYRYHEALVHPAMINTAAPKKILVLGGGDGLAVREILKYKNIEQIFLVDLDKEITNLFSSNKMLITLNGKALLSDKITIINQDAYMWLKENKHSFDVIIVDFPDPSNYSVGKLYTNAFYKIVTDRLNENGTIVVQSTSPLAAPKSYWCIVNTLESVGFKTLPYHAYVPSFGEWGYVMASKKSFSVNNTALPEKLKFISKNTFEQMLFFPEDMKRQPTEINKLNNQILVSYFESEWSNYAL